MKTLSALALVLMCSMAAQAGVISDTYWGGSPTDGSTRNIVGDAGIFGINSLTYSVTGGILNVAIATNYVNYAGLNGTGLGDLFLAEAWTPYGTGPQHTQDTLSNGTDWTFVAVLDQHIGASSGVLGIFPVAGRIDPRIIQSSSSPGYIYRAGQAVQYNTNGLTALGTGSWNISGGSLNMSLPLAAFGDETVGAVSWGATCGNNIIQGAMEVSQVPEPGTAWLLALGAGLIGGGRLAERLRHRK